MKHRPRPIPSSPKSRSAPAALHGIFERAVALHRALALAHDPAALAAIRRRQRAGLAPEDIYLEAAPAAPRNPTVPA
jgi:hypothetical protein